MLLLVHEHSVPIVASQMLLCKTNVYKVKKKYHSETFSKSRVW